MIRTNEITTRDITNRLTEGLDKDFIRSFYVAGTKSNPNTILEKGQDVDYFIIFKEKKRKEFFQNLENTNYSITESFPTYEASLYKGPMKKQDKIMGHFTLFTDAKQDPYDVDGTNNASIHDECPHMLEQIFKNGTLLKGEALDSVLRYGVDNLDLSTKQTWPEEHYEILTKTNKISFREWMQDKDNIWKLMPSEKNAPLGSSLRKSLDKYFLKYIQNNN